MAKKKKAKELPLWDVSFSYTTRKYYTVRAATREEAEAKAERRNNDPGGEPDDFWESSETCDGAERAKE